MLFFKKKMLHSLSLIISTLYGYPLHKLNDPSLSNFKFQSDILETVQRCTLDGLVYEPVFRFVRVYDVSHFALSFSGVYLSSGAPTPPQCHFLLVNIFPIPNQSITNFQQYINLPLPII